MEPYLVLPLQVRVDLRVMVMKRYSTLLKAPKLVPHYQMQFNVILKTLLLVCACVCVGASLSPLQGMQSKPWKSCGNGLVMCQEPKSF